MSKKVKRRSMWGKQPGGDPLPLPEMDEKVAERVREAWKKLPPPPGIDHCRPHPDADPRRFVLD